MLASPLLMIWLIEFLRWLHISTAAIIWIQRVIVLARSVCLNHFIIYGEDCFYSSSIFGSYLTKSMVMVRISICFAKRFFGNIFWNPVSRTITKFEDPRMFAIALSTWIFLHNELYALQLITSCAFSNVNVLIIWISLRVSLVAAYCASTSSGGFLLTDSSVVKDTALKAHTTKLFGWASQLQSGEGQSESYSAFLAW